MTKRLSEVTMKNLWYTQREGDEGEIIGGVGWGWAAAQTTQMPAPDVAFS